MKSFQKSVVDWFRKSKRSLPWRETSDPYKIWISEIMCQQTGVGTVVPYYERFMARFPRVEDLAEAEEEEVIKLWEGLGYYSRARNIHRAAQLVVNEFDSELPKSKQEILRLPGVGEYSAGAILSIAHQVATPALDGNLIRVYARYFGIEEEVSRPEVLRRLWQVASEMLPQSKSMIRDFTEGMMELGALVCRPKNPSCNECPIRENCVAKHEQLQSVIPRKAKPRGRVKLKELIYLNRKRNRIALLQKGADIKYPHFFRLPFKAVKAQPQKIELIRKYKYSVTHRDFEVFLVSNRIEDNLAKNLKWMTAAELKKAPLPAIDRKIINEQL